MLDEIGGYEVDFQTGTMVPGSRWTWEERESERQEWREAITCQCGKEKKLCKCGQWYCPRCENHEC